MDCCFIAGERRLASTLTPRFRPVTRAAERQAQSLSPGVPGGDLAGRDTESTLVMDAPVADSLNGLEE